MDMKNYRKVNGCWNCLHVFMLVVQDDPHCWYCNNTCDRPPCGVCNYKTHKECHLHAEDGTVLPDEEMMRRSQAWYAWADKHEVDAYGICDNWKEREG